MGHTQAASIDRPWLVHTNLDKQNTNYLRSLPSCLYCYVRGWVWRLRILVLIAHARWQLCAGGCARNRARTRTTRTRQREAAGVRAARQAAGTADGAADKTRRRRAALA